MTGLCEHKHMFDATPWLVIYPAKLIIFRFFFGWTSICHFCLQTIRGQLTLRTFVGFSRRLNPIFDHVKISMVFGRCKKWHQRGLDRPIIFADFRRRYRTLTPLDWWIDHLDHIMWFVENMKSPNLNIDPTASGGHLFFACTCYFDNGLAVWLGGSFHFRSNLLILQAVLLPKMVKVPPAGSLFPKIFLRLFRKRAIFTVSVRQSIIITKKRSSKSNWNICSNNQNFAPSLFQWFSAFFVTLLRSGFLTVSWIIDSLNWTFQANKVFLQLFLQT